MLAQASSRSGWGRVEVGKVDLAYYTVRRGGRGFWEPTKKMREHGFASVACGPDGPNAWAMARKWNERWQRVRRGEEPSPTDARRPGADPEAILAAKIYPKGSCGEAFERLRLIPEVWAVKAAATREEWFRVWWRLEPLIGDVAPSTMTLEDFGLIRTDIERRVSLREAHRVTKVWRAMWKIFAAMGYCQRASDPSLGIRNNSADPRQASWSEGEVVRLVKAAWRKGYKGLAAVMAVGWDSQLSPVDLRRLAPEQAIRSARGVAFLIGRAKTGRAAAGTLGMRATALVDGYVATLGVELMAHVPIFRNRSGRAYSKDTLGDDFRAVRNMVFGASETRTLADFRRSGAIEALSGNASSEAISAKMANTLSASNALHKTYVPVDLETVYAVDAARRLGRQKLASKTRQAAAFNSKFTL